MYFDVDGVRYWVMLGPSGFILYRKEGSRSKYLGRRSITEIKEMLAKASTEESQRLKAELEALKQAIESQKPAQTTQTAQPSLTWKKDGHTYWVIQYNTSFYIYMKGPSTRHRPRLIKKTDINGVISHVTAADAAHVLEALRELVNGLHAAVSDLAKPPAEEKPLSKPQEAQVPRREAEEALKELKRELSRAVKKWDEEWKRKASWGEPDKKWLREKLSKLINDNMNLVEKMLPYEDLLDKFAGAAAEATAGHLTRHDVLESLNQL
jgi:gas vesicle protein